MLQEQIDELMPYMDEFDMTHEQKIEYIKLIWEIMGSEMDKYIERFEINKTASLHPRNHD
ncbi:MAG: hypothetical protein ABJH28_07935 [Paraglaciecola sp.]|uniref:hypothetical protein n=1 Tax=Paraglaciecola sp. TaxID=1920173 RepID=UPI003266D3E2